THDASSCDQPSSWLASALVRPTWKGDSCTMHRASHRPSADNRCELDRFAAAPQGMDEGIPQESGNISGAVARLENLNKHLNGCGTVPANDDWIIKCPEQVRIRTLTELLIANLQR